jgi:type IV secretory pathway VirB2 component (pilin)
MIDDSSGVGALDAAVNWIRGSLTGSLASTIAVIAVSSVGLLLLSGRLEMRRAVQVIFGCFILFGASSIASGLMGVMSGQVAIAEPPVAPPPPMLVPRSPPPTAQAPANYGPYAGAAVPRVPR